MSTSLSNLVDNLSEGIHNNRYADCKSFLDYMKTKDENLIFKCFSCKKNYEKDYNKELIERFANIYEFCNEDLNKFILLLRKGVCPYEYIDNWERFDETSLPDKESFYSSLNMENIDDIKNTTIYTCNATLYYLLMYLKILEICALKFMSSTLLISYHYQDWHSKHA